MSAILLQNEKWWAKLKIPPRIVNAHNHKKFNLSPSYTKLFLTNTLYQVCVGVCGGGCGGRVIWTPYYLDQHLVVQASNFATY